ncbi:MAG: radical SAM protein, partial [Rhodospirillaceae bacterium]|nr:radical SAM protein [Rhodospirillaceae bacterium]
MQVLLLSTYDLGHQPFSLASPAAKLKSAGAAVTCNDLAVDSLNEDAVKGADLIGLYLQMHT